MIAKNELISLGIKKLKMFGYSHVNKRNILSDEVYRIFFDQILRERLQENAEEREVIICLLQKIKLNTLNTSNP